MPLKTGKSQEAVQSNVAELMHKYKKTGKIGSSKPKSKKAAQKQAVAIALSQAGKSKKMNEQAIKMSFEETVNALLAEYNNLK